jgi:soluble epoxide hydrolase/lipid-phosphate phosphatase
LLDYVDLNPSASTSIIFVHGWPGLWSTWSNQILEFQVRVLSCDYSTTYDLHVPRSGRLSSPRARSPWVRFFNAPRQLARFHGRSSRRSRLHSRARQSKLGHMYWVCNTTFTISFYSRRPGNIRHDWGSQICFEAARMRPDVFGAVAGTIPVSPLSIHYSRFTLYLPRSISPLQVPSSPSKLSSLLSHGSTTNSSSTNRRLKLLQN